LESDRDGLSMPLGATRFRGDLRRRRGSLGLDHVLCMTPQTRFRDADLVGDRLQDGFGGDYCSKTASCNQRDTGGLNGTVIYLKKMILEAVVVEDAFEGAARSYHPQPFS
jgi:hypothetical protein